MTPSRNPELGIHLLETITRGMYSEPMHAIREYVQNAFDSIRQGWANGTISPSDGSIQVVVDLDARRLTIRDSGIGLSPEEATVRLLDIGMSQKAQDEEHAQQNIGFRGIGRMAGISYCKRLRFETSNGNGKGCVIEFDAAQINRLTLPGQSPITIEEAIRENVDIRETDCTLGQRYFHVVLEGILDEAISFLDTERLHRYLAVVAPVAYDPSIWRFGPRIEAIAESFDSANSLGSVRITICDNDGAEQVDIRRPFSETFGVLRKGHETALTVSDVRSLVGDTTSPRGWWGWIAQHPLEGTLGRVPFAGIGIRMHNMGIGDHRIVGSLFKTSSLAKWCFGEIHITDFRVVPNAQRDNFEPSKAWRIIQGQIREEVANVERLCRRASGQRSRQKKLNNPPSPSPASGTDSKHERDGSERETGSLATSRSEMATAPDIETQIEGGTTNRETDINREMTQHLHYQETQESSEYGADRSAADLVRGGEQNGGSLQNSRRSSLAALDEGTRSVYQDIRRVLEENLPAELFENLDLKILKVLEERRDG